MPIGAPDHTRLSDDAFSHYQWRQLRSGVNIPLISTVETTIIDISLTGVVGVFITSLSYNDIRINIYVDDIELGYQTPLWQSHKARMYSGGNNLIWGLNKYDIVNDWFIMFWDAGFRCYVKKSFKITALQFSGVNKSVNNYSLTYLELKT